MTIKLILLKSGEDVIADVSEMILGEGDEKRVPAVEGRLIIFPAGFTHTHRGNPPLGQEKIILTTWGTVNQ